MRQKARAAAPAGKHNSGTWRPVMKHDLRAYWRTNIYYMAVLLCVWAAVSYLCGIVFVRELNAVMLGGFPLGFWFAQQGSIFGFLVIILVYFLLMRRLDRKYGIDE
jgi:putative solute:sodium symporter small subunit